MGKPRIKTRRRAKKAVETSAVSARFAEERTRAKKSRADMAEALGWSEIKLWRIETGRQRPLADDVSAYARVLEVPVERFYEAA